MFCRVSDVYDFVVTQTVFEHSKTPHGKCWTLPTFRCGEPFLINLRLLSRSRNGRIYKTKNFALSWSPTALHWIPYCITQTYRQDEERGKNQQDATIRCLLLTSVSTCFGHHYAHLQENKDLVTAFGVLLWFCWMWLVAVVGRCVVGCEHCVAYLRVCSVEWSSYR